MGKRRERALQFGVSQSRGGHNAGYDLSLPRTDRKPVCRTAVNPLGFSLPRERERERECVCVCLRARVYERERERERERELDGFGQSKGQMAKKEEGAEGWGVGVKQNRRRAWVTEREVEDKRGGGGGGEGKGSLTQHRPTAVSRQEKRNAKRGNVAWSYPDWFVDRNASDEKCLHLV